MIDLFGLGHKDPKEPNEQPEPAAAAPGAAPAVEKPRAPRGSQALWGILLFLDSLFVIVFGGAVAMIASKYWQAPAASVASIGRRRPAPAKAAKPAEAPKPPEPAPAPAVKPPEPPKAAARAEMRTAKAADSPRPPKPSLLNEPPKPRATPALAAVAAAPAAAAAAADGRSKALPVVFKLHAPDAGGVQLVGAFIVRGGRKDMAKGKDGTWSVKLYLNPGQYRYFFSVDKKKTLDPENPRSDRGASLVGVP